MRPQDLSPPDFAVVRTPLLPFRTLETWGEGFTCAGRPNDESVYREDLARAREKLGELLVDPVVREALHLASPGLLERAGDAQRDQGIESALVRYVTRMASRCTPFGLFAGCTRAAIGRETRVELNGKARRRSRLDMHLLDALIQALAAHPELAADLRFVRNTSVYPAADKLRYAESRATANGRSYFLVDVEPHEPLLRGLEAARTPRTLDEIARAIGGEEIDPEEARRFAGLLVEAQLLTPALGPAVTGDGALEFALEELAHSTSAAEVRKRLERVRASLHALDEAGPGQSLDGYQQLRSHFEGLVETDPKRLVQVDLYRPGAQATVSQDLAEELLRTAFLLRDLFSYGAADSLADFKRAFEARYEERTVPLAEVLDEEMGLGFQRNTSPNSDPSPLLEGLPFPAGEQLEQVHWGSPGRFLLQLVAKALAEGLEEVVVEPKDLAALRRDDAMDMPDALHVIGTVLDGEDPRAFLDSAGGPSGVRLLGRFCHLDPELEADVRRHIQAEEALDPTVRYFEVVHLPEGRTGNILARPNLRGFELEFLGTSGAPPEQRLTLDDLTVTVSQGRVVLHSRRLGCEVRPRLTSAHDSWSRGLAVYRFLNAVQMQGKLGGAEWNWGPLTSQPRLPRVRIGRVVVAKQQWNLPSAEIASLEASGHEGFGRVQAWRTTKKLPRWIGLVDMDNVLAVDLDNPLLVQAFLDALKGREEAIVQEIFCGARGDVVQSPQGPLWNEVVVPFVRRAETVRVPRPVAPMAEPVPQVFAPGSEWLSAKIYTGAEKVDELLTTVVAPLTKRVQDEGLVDGWFFLRFGDPDWHLRVRWHGDPARLCGELLPVLHAQLEPWIADRRVAGLLVDTYRRESRRYGGPEAMEHVERIFHADSIAAVNFLAMLGGDAGLDLRWRMAAVGMDRLMDDAGLDLESRRALCDALANSFGHEFHLDAPLRARLRERYREERRAFDQALDGEWNAPIEPVLRRRSEMVAPAFAALRQLEHPTASLQEILASLLHMHANRVLRTSQRAHEMVLHRFLEKSYASRLARQKKGRT